MIAKSGKYLCVYGGTLSLPAWLEATLPGTSICRFSQPQECLRELSRKPCDLLIVDFAGGLTEGLDLIAEARQILPWLCSIAVIDAGNISVAIRAMKARACDCLERPVGQDHWREVIETQLRRAEGSGLHPCRSLTPTEVQVLQLLIAGKTSRAIARELYRSPRTVETHRQRIMRKLNAPSMLELVRRVLARGPA